MFEGVWRQIFEKPKENLTGDMGVWESTMTVLMGQAENLAEVRE